MVPLLCQYLSACAGRERNRLWNKSNAERIQAEHLILVMQAYQPEHYDHWRWNSVTLLMFCWSQIPNRTFIFFLFVSPQLEWQVTFVFCRIILAQSLQLSVSCCKPGFRVFICSNKLMVLLLQLLQSAVCLFLVWYCRCRWRIKSLANQHQWEHTQTVPGNLFIYL